MAIDVKSVVIGGIPIRVEWTVKGHEGIFWDEGNVCCLDVHSLKLIEWYT